MTIEEKKLELYDIEPNCEPNCYESDREEQWHQCGLHEGFEDGHKFAIEQALIWISAELSPSKKKMNEFKKYMEGGEE